MTILLIDDSDEFSSEFVRYMVDIEEAEVIVQSEVTDAKSFINTPAKFSSVDICFIDHDLKNSSTSGTDLVKDIRIVNSFMPIVLLTHHDDQAIAFQAGQFGATLFVNKGSLVSRNAFEGVLRKAWLEDAKQSQERVSKFQAKYSRLAHIAKEVTHDIKDALLFPLRSSLTMICSEADGALEEIATLLQRVTDAECIHRLHDVQFIIQRLKGEISQIDSVTHHAEQNLEQLSEFAISEEPTLRPTINDISLLVAECIDLYLNKDRPVRTHVDVSAARFDAIAVKRILRALLTNVENHIQSFVKVEISVKRVVRGQTTFIRFSVRDYGPGIDNRIMRTLFDPGVSQKLAGSRHIGKGLGLTIARHNAELHRVGDQRGRIFSEPPTDGTGAQFIFEIPVDFVE
jgi:signal transduction histidine kinase